MGQQVLLDRPGLLVYLPLILIVGCHPDPGPLVPVNAVPVGAEQIRSWVTSTAPTGHRLYQFNWLFRNERSSAGGVGRVRVAGPDTLRFDARGPLGSGRMAAVVVGDQALWAEPEDQVAQVVPNYPLLWAMFGVARMPDAGASFRGLDDTRITVWEYASQGDTVVYSRSKDAPVRFIAEIRRAGRLYGRVETRLSTSGQPVSARLIVPDVPAQLDIKFVANTPDTVFPPDTWLPPSP
jgi:hypothetical protein